MRRWFLVFNTDKGTTSLVANCGVELIQALGLSTVLNHQQALSILGCERDEFGAIISSIGKIWNHCSLLRLDQIESTEVRDSVSRGTYFRLRIGRFDLKITSPIPEFTRALVKLYGRYLPPPMEAHSYTTSQFRHRTLFGNGSECCLQPFWGCSFLPMEIGHSHALFEWGLNWTIGTYAHNYLIMHSAVLEKDTCQHPTCSNFGQW